MASDLIGRDPLGVTNAVRVRQGREPINPFMIEGFGGDDAPPPPMAELPEPLKNEPWPDEEERAGSNGPTPPPSPMVPQGFGAPATLPVPENMPIPELLVINRAAQYRGTEVELDEMDHKAIAVVVLRAAQRKFTTQLSELAGRRVRQPRKARVGLEQVIPVPVAVAAPGEPAVPPKRKRGRPRKHPLPVPPPQPDPDPSV